MVILTIKKSNDGLVIKSHLQWFYHVAKRCFMSSASCHVNECRLSVVKSLPLYTFPSGSNPITLYVNSDLRTK